MRDDFLVFGRPTILDPEIEEVISTLRSGWLGTGPRVARFEEAFRLYKGADHAVALNSCTAALHVALQAVGIGPGDEVITSTLTFAATANAIVHAGARPVFVDVDPATMNLHPDLVADAISSRTRAILPVHFAGRPCAMDKLLTLARDHDLRLIEDCAHAVEATYRGRPTGTFGDVSCFSFYVTKNMTTGEGGMLLTPDAAIADAAKTLSLHGLTHDAWHRFGDPGYRHYQVVQPGYKYNMTDLQAALGIHQLARLEASLPRRQEIWNRYDAGFADLPLTTPAPPEPGTRHARHLYTLVLDTDSAQMSRDALLQRLTHRKIGVGVHYLPVHTHPFYMETYGYRRGEFPVAEYIGDRTFSIPLSPSLTDEDVSDVIATVRNLLSSSAPISAALAED